MKEKETNEEYVKITMEGIFKRKADGSYTTRQPLKTVKIEEIKNPQEILQP